MTSDSAFLPYQQRLFKAVSAHPVVAIEKSRRTGYTFALAALAVLTAAEEGGQSVFYMGYDFAMAREFMAYVARIAEALGRVSESTGEEGTPEGSLYRLTFPSGRAVVALPSVPRALRGKQGLVLIDEAAFLDDLPEVLKAAFALLIWGGKVVVCSTHNGEDNPFNLLLKEIREGKKPYAIEKCTFDDALKDGLFRRICARSGTNWSKEAQEDFRREIVEFYGDAADEELFCVPSRSGGQYIPRFLLERAQDGGLPVLRLALADGEALPVSWMAERLLPLLADLSAARSHTAGFDFGRSGDLSVLWVLDDTLKTALVLEMGNIPHETQKNILFTVLEKLPRLQGIALDAGGNGSYVAEATHERFGVRLVSRVQLSQNWYRDNMPPLKSAFEQGTLRIPDDRDIVGDFSVLRLKNGIASVPQTRVKGADGRLRHGDAAIACALALSAKPAAAPSYDYSSYDSERKNFFKKGIY